MSNYSREIYGLTLRAGKIPLIKNLEVKLMHADFYCKSKSKTDNKSLIITPFSVRPRACMIGYPNYPEASGGAVVLAEPQSPDVMARAGACVE